MRFGDATTDALALSAVSAVVPSLTIRTSFTPPATIIIQPPQSGGGAPDPLMSILRPAIDFQTAAGPVTLAPFGDPLGTSSVTGWAMMAGVAVAAFAGLFVWMGTKLK